MFIFGRIIPARLGIFDEISANVLLDVYSDDGYDGNFDYPLPPNASVLYKVFFPLQLPRLPLFQNLFPQVFVPVHRNRSIETTARLMDPQNNVLLNFTVRAHGQNQANGWCFVDSLTLIYHFSLGEPLNQFSSNGETPTVLISFVLQVMFIIYYDDNYYYYY
jgi:hypothetical protein